MTASLPKAERLFLKNDINRLFGEGKYVTVSGFRCCYVSNNGVGYNRILVSVSKKFFKRAVKRNLLKRRIREAYRLNKSSLPLVAGQGCDIAIIYISKDVRDQKTITEGVVELLQKVSQIVSAAPADGDGQML